MINDFYAGTTFTYTVNEIPTATNELTLSIVKATNYVYTFEKDYEANNFKLTITSFETADITPDTYSYSIELKDGDVVSIVDIGTFKVLPNPALLTSFDNRSHAKKVLDAIEAVIEGRATRDEMKYNINGRYLEKTPIGDLLLLRDRYKREVRNEEKAEQLRKGLTKQNIIRTRFKA